MKDNIKSVYNGTLCKDVKGIQLAQNMYECRGLAKRIKYSPFSIQKGEFLE